jgi:RNA polymerase sigma-54 factor
VNVSLETSLKLSQTLSPQMIQSLKLLQYSNLQLEQVIRKELQENPILEEEEPEEDAAPEADKNDDGPEAPETEGQEKEGQEKEEPENDKTETVVSDKEKSEDLNWDDYFNDGFDPGYRRTEDERINELYEKVPVSNMSLEEHLLKQLTEKKLSPKETEIGEFIIGNINDNGYLVLDPAEIAGKLGVEVKAVDEIRHIIQRFDPMGVASLNLRECLTIQVYQKGLDGTVMARIIRDHFELLKKYNLPEIARQINLAVSEVQAAVREIGKLEPNPGTVVSSGKPQIITPELTVEKLDSGEFSVTLNGGNVPNIRVSRSYLDLLRKEKKRTPEIKKYVSDRLNSANWLIRSIEQRKVTMLKVMNAIVERQKEWFEKGPPHLRPLILQQIADDISMHISTVCRVTNDKYVQTPYGIFELKYFFGSGVEQEDGTEVSTSSAKEVLRELVGQEDKKRPLSDQKLVELLAGKGIEVARRTVSKYREQLNILPARMRKEF